MLTIAISSSGSLGNPPLSLAESALMGLVRAVLLLLLLLPLGFHSRAVVDDDDYLFNWYIAKSVIIGVLAAKSRAIYTFTPGSFASRAFSLKLNVNRDRAVTQDAPWRE